MRRIARSFTILLLLSVVVPLSAWAQQRGLFLIRNPLQYVDVTYEFRNLNGGGASSSTHILRPEYHLGFDYAIYDPDILVGSASVTGKAEGSAYSSSSGASGASTSFRKRHAFFPFWYSSSSGSSGASGSSGSSAELGFVEYNISGTVLNRKPVSFDFISRYHLDTAQPQFSPSYNIHTYYSKAGTRYKGPLLPTSLSYSAITTRTAGLSNNTTTHNRLLTLESNHTYRNLSVTKLNFTYNNLENTQSYQSYATQHSYAAVDISNNLALNLPTKSFFLGSGLNLQKDYGDYSGTTLQWRETFTARLGRALQTGLNYNYYRIDRTASKQATNNVEGWVEHQLYSSLRTRLAVKGNYDSYDIGHINTTTGTAGVAYAKLIPNVGMLTFQISDSYEVKDQTLRNTTMLKQNEPPITLNGPLDNYELQEANIDTTTIRFTRVDHTPLQSPAFTTRVTGTKTYISILDTTSLPPTVLITYSYAVNQQITYGTNTFNVNGNLSLLQGRSFVFINYERREQYLFDGQPTYVTLGSSLTFRGGGEYRYQDHTFGAEYQNVDFLNNSRDLLSGYWRYFRAIGQFSVNTELRDAYTWYSTTGGVSYQADFSDNSLSALLNVSRRFFRNGVLQFTGNYQMLRGDSPNRDDLMLRLRYTWSMGKFMLLCDFQTFIRELSSSSQNNNHIKFEVRRYF